MKMPLKTAWTLPKLNRIIFIAFEETMKIGKDGSWLNLVRMDQQFKDFSRYMDRIGDDNNFGHVIEIWCLVNTIFDSEEFCFSVCNMNRIVDHLYNQSVVHICMWYQCSNIVLDARIWSYDGGRREWWWLQDYFIKLIGVIFIVFFFVTDIERKIIWKIVNYSTSRRKFWMKRRKRWETFVKPIGHVD